MNANSLGRSYWGKFRGTVTNNLDPKGEGRVLVTIPAISAKPLVNWAAVCLPMGGTQHGFFSIPPLKAKVWVEFENGDIDYPIISGYMVEKKPDIPKNAPTPNPVMQSITMQTPTGNTIIISDLPANQGGVQLMTRMKQKITLTDQGIEIDNGMGATIKMVGPSIQINAAQVDINKGALTVV